MYLQKNYKYEILNDPDFREYLKKAAEYEKVSEEHLIEGIEKGTIVVVGNKKRLKRIKKPLAIGEGLLVKVNANIGTSDDYHNLDEELKKLKVAIKYGADAVMDLSTGGDLDEIRKRILELSDVPVGSVPIYSAAVEAVEIHKKSILHMTVDEILKAFEKHITDGIDFITIHAGVTKETVKHLIASKRIEGIVSRGGSILARWIVYNEKENPLYEHFDKILEMAKEYNVTLSLGDGFRPGATIDATDKGQISELIVLAELVEKAREYGVQVMVEGPGHVPLNMVVENIKIMKSLTKGAPFYILGPLVTDISIGYDHIAGAIGGALAAMEGADFLCYLTPAEHLALPDVNDVKEGVIASKIAAHAADVARGKPQAWEKEIKMAKAKRVFRWEEIFSLTFDPEKARSYREKRPPSGDEEKCTMCGKFCALREEPEVAKKMKGLL